jgi:glyoxylase-like metal-dependent hydrolase (beta-lactamase superfamily II)
VPAERLLPITDQVYRIEDRFVNLYVLDLGKIVLVDTGTKSAEPLIRSSLREIGKEVEDIAVLLLTHHHLDHVGTAGVWKHEARAQVNLHRDDAPVAAHEVRRRSHGVGARAKALSLFMGVFTRLMSADPVTTDRILEGGETLDILGWPVDVIHAPGHTLGSCAFYARSAGVLFAGDAVNGRRGKAEPPIFVEDRDAAGDSFRKLTALDATILLPGHGSPVRRP